MPKCASADMEQGRLCSILFLTELCGKLSILVRKCSVYYWLPFLTQAIERHPPSLHLLHFVDALASFLASPKFTCHELGEYVPPAVHSESSAAIQSAPTHVLELAHELAFCNGLGYSLYANSQTTGDITAEDVRDLHAQAVGKPSSIAVLGTGISTESLAKLFERAFSSYKAPATRIPTTPTAPATKYHGGAACVASTHDPRAISVGFGSTASASVPALHTLAAHLNPASALKWASCASPLASAILVGVRAHSVLLPYSDATRGDSGPKCIKR